MFQGSTCLEAGSYLLNYLGCAVCKAMGLLQEVERERHEDNNEETISFKREQAWTCRMRNRVPPRVHTLTHAHTCTHVHTHTHTHYLLYITMPPYSLQMHVPNVDIL